MAVTLELFQERALSQLRSGNVLVGEVARLHSNAGGYIIVISK